MTYYLVKCQNKLLFNNNRNCSYVTSILSPKKTMVSWSNFLEKVIDDFKIIGYYLNHI